MAQDKFADWKSKAEAAQILRCSHKTIERLAGQNKIQKHMRRIPGRRSTPVYHPDDIEALRNDTANLEPFPMDAAARQDTPNEALLPATAAQARAGDIFLHLLNSGLPAATVAPQHKLFLTLKEAVAYSGMPRGWLLQRIKAGELKAVKVGGWRIPRADLEQQQL